MDPPDCSGPDCKQNCPYQQYPVSLLAGLQDLRNADNFSDITIRVGEKTFKGHRVVLAASSPYFRAMFTGGLSETNKKEVKIETIEAETFSLLLDFIYQGSITLTTDNCQEVLIAANLLQLTALMHKCIVFLSKKLDPSNVSDVINFAIALDMPVLHKTAEDMALSRFREVFWRTEFLTLSEKTVIEIFKSENIAVCHESEVLEAAVLYLEHHYSKNPSLVPRIMDTIRLTLIANKNRNEIIERIQSKELKEEIAVITKKVKTHVMSYDTPLMEQPRIMASRKIYVLGGEKEPGWDATPLNSLDCLDLDTKEWQETVQFETKDDDGLIKLDRSLFGVAVLFADIFVIGGEKDGQVFDNVETYNTITKSWSRLAGMLHHRSGLAACALDGYVYVMGGCPQDDGCFMERYDPDGQGQWTMIDARFDLTASRMHLKAVVCEGLIYVAGGIDADGSSLNCVDLYNPVTKVWESVNRMKLCRGRVSLAEVNGSLVATGGIYESTRYARMESLEVSGASNRWGSYMTAGFGKDPRLYSIGHASTLYLFGPSDNKNDNAFTDRLLPDRYISNRLTPIPVPRCDAALAIV